MLDKGQRLRTRQEFSEVFERGRSGANRLLVLYRLRVGRARDPVKVGFSVSSRLGGAVVRNRIKRRLREAFRSLRPYMRGGYHLIFIARQASQDAHYHGLRQAMIEMLRRSQLLLVEPEPEEGSSGGSGGEGADS